MKKFFRFPTQNKNPRFIWNETQTVDPETKKQPESAEKPKTPDKMTPEEYVKAQIAKLEEKFGQERHQPYKETFEDKLDKAIKLDPKTEKSKEGIDALSMKLNEALTKARLDDVKKNYGKENGIIATKIKEADIRDPHAYDKIINNLANNHNLDIRNPENKDLNDEITKQIETISENELPNRVSEKFEDIIDEKIKTYLDKNEPKNKEAVSKSIGDIILNKLSSVDGILEKSNNEVGKIIDGMNIEALVKADSKFHTDYGDVLESEGTAEDKIKELGSKVDIDKYQAINDPAERLVVIFGDIFKSMMGKDIDDETAQSYMKNAVHLENPGRARADTAYLNEILSDKNMDLPPKGKEILENAKKHIGKSERSNPDEIRQFHASAGLNAGPDTPWCASFVSHVLKESGINNIQGSVSSREFLNKGTPTTTPKPGDLMIVERGSGGHIGIYLGNDKAGRSVILGGNQSNRVSIKTETRRLLGYRTFS